MSVEAGNKVTKLSLGGQAIAKLLGGKHVKYDGGSLHGDYIEIYGHSTEVRCACPECHCESHSYHSSYIRTLRSLPISGKPVIIHLAVRKYRCMNPSCPRRVFSGQVPGLTESHSRKTVYVKEYLERLLVEVSSVKGAYIAGLSGIPCSASSCLRVLDRLPAVPEVAPSARRLCIDDFAYRKGQNYGSIIIDADTHRVLEIFEGRNKETAVAALKKYQGVEAVGRDRANDYARALEQALPGAEQVADKFHLVKNCVEHMQEQLKAMSATVLEELEESFSAKNPPPPARLPLNERESDIRDRKYYGPITKRLAMGMSEERIHAEYRFSCEAIAQCARDLRYTPLLPAIRDAAREGASVATLRSLAGIPDGGSLKGFARWLEDTFPGYDERVRCLAREKSEYFAERKRMTADIVGNRKLKLYVASEQYGVNRKTGECSKEHQIMNRAIQSSATLSVLRQFVSSFRNMINGSDPDKLERWIMEYSTSGMKELGSFAKGLEKDIAAVRNAIIYDLTNGPVEGMNNRLKALKRSMYGRAGNRLLMTKMIHAKNG